MNKLVWIGWPSLMLLCAWLGYVNGWRAFFFCVGAAMAAVVIAGLIDALLHAERIDP